MTLYIHTHRLQDHKLIRYYWQMKKGSDVRDQTEEDETEMDGER